MFGQPVGDGSARAKIGRRSEKRGLRWGAARRNQTMHGICAASLSVALIASSFAFSAPAIAASTDSATIGTTDAQEATVPRDTVGGSVLPTASESDELSNNVLEQAVESPSPAATATVPTAKPLPETDADQTSSPSPVRRSQKADMGDQSALAASGLAGISGAYVHWEVVDEKGKPVSGAAFTFERQTNRKWTGSKNIQDCVSSSCSVIDRDSKAGQYLIKWIDSDAPGANPSGNTITAGSRYRIKPANPPTGYEWVSSTAVVDSNSLSWSGQGENQTLDFGTFVVRKSSFVPVCEAGYVYGLSGTGQMQSVSPAGVVSNFGKPAVSVSDFNGLGIGLGGSSAFAYERSNQATAATIYRFDSTTGAWASTGASVDSRKPAREVQFVAGAVNLDTGRYLIGGYTPRDNSPRVFRIWEYDPAKNAVSYKGHLATDSGRYDATNGDMAFDANGNLFVVRGNGTNTTIYSVTAENLANATTGGLIPSSVSKQVSTMDSVNGVAFDADGKGYLSSDTIVRSYDMPGWTNPKEVSKALSKSTDLASCGSPPTITIEKYIEGGRVAATDQFNLTLRQGGTAGIEIGTSTTAGDKDGLQDERVGPMPTVRNVELYFSESAAGTTKLADYASSYRCLVDGEQKVQGNGIAGVITIPAHGQAVECRFYNSPLIAQVNVHKQITDSKGQNPEPGSNWSVGATAKATKGTIKSAPASAMQQTNAAGTASWKFAFGGRDHTADLSVQELMQDGYGFMEGSCTVTALDGTSKETVLSGTSANPNVAIVPGDVVDCTFVNSLKPAKVMLGKQLQDVAGQNPKPAAGWTVGTTLEPGNASGVSISTPETAQTATNGKVEKPWIVDFPTKPGARAQVRVQETMQDGYDFVSGTCQITAANGTTREQPLNAVSGVLTGLAPGEFADCTFTNKPKPGAITWEKVDATGSALRGSEWELTGPGSSSTATAITDCVAADASKCVGEDKDPKAGGFQLTGLHWGTYTLVEAKAPAGFVLDETSYTITVGAKAPAQIVWDLGQITNEQREGLDLPLTGGTGTQTFLFGGGAVLLAALGVVAWRRKTTAPKN
ncbi:SpaA isopeptide-forming pilin-related protein [Glutamicibacter protophormiae]